MPPESAAGIVHGDYRLDNALVGPDDRIRAVVAWEMATLGGPLAGLALMLTYQRLAYLQGQTVGEGFDTIGDVIRPLLDAGLAVLDDD